MKQKDLAQRIGISRTYLNGIIKRRRIPSRKLAKRIARFTGTHWLDFRESDKEILRELTK